MAHDPFRQYRNSMRKLIERSMARLYKQILHKIKKQQKAMERKVKRGRHKKSRR